MLLKTTSPVNSLGIFYENFHNDVLFSQVIAQEYLTPEQHSSMAEVTVYLEDVNDNWPEFEKNKYNTSIEENSPRDTFVIQIIVSPSTLIVNIISQSRLAFI